MSAIFDIERRWRYRWWHFPTGETGEDETFCETSAYGFLAMLSEWNRCGGATWKYAAAPGQCLPAAPLNTSQ